ncbi:HWE histidine kinase domain-containing protein [Mesorhizobium cantuariense]|uniref:histidine kinase n=1 Tax=Mesorhizobium cantuariense TaxID=1300275 RepID=A0ABV7MPW6_9HYPH
MAVLRLIDPSARVEPRWIVLLIAAFEGRLMALSAAHNILTQTSWSRHPWANWSPTVSRSEERLPTGSQ